MTVKTNGEATAIANATDDAVVILIPIYNDWEALDEVLLSLDRVLVEHRIGASVLVVDDDSSTAPGAAIAGRRYEAIGRVEVLRLRRNLGHQRAIAIGLAYLEANRGGEALVVMDGDGEDDPRDVPRLVAKCREERGRKIVFAERTKRSESWMFRIFYFLYRQLHLLLTGYAVRVGNFSVIPWTRLVSLVVVSDLWNHYAAAAFRSRQPYCTIPTHRARRLHGRSSMNFVSLTAHGLSAISVYSEVIGVRLLVANAVFIGLTFSGILAIVYIRLMTDRAIPGWATYSTGILLILLSQGLMLTLIFCLFVLGGRHSSAFLPCRDYGYFVREVAVLAPRNRQHENPHPDPLPGGEGAN
jgi:glycosyltransferase involved in cell wall biosynthesis